MINEQPKSKILIIIIGILLIANVVMLAFFMFGTNHKQKRDRSGKNSYVGEYLKKEVGFNDLQLNTYDSLSKQHREQVKIRFGELSAKRTKIFETLAAASYSDSAINNAANAMHDRQVVLELSMLQHLKDIREICSPDQLRRFDTGFYKIFGRRGGTPKEK